MDGSAGVQTVMATFELERSVVLDVARELVDDPAVVVDEAARRLEEMAATLAYVDRPDHPAAGMLFQCATSLALFLVLRERGVDAHTFGRAHLRAIA